MLSLSGVGLEGARRACGPACLRRLHASAPRGEAVRCSELDLSGKVAFVAGVAVDKGYGWAVARQLARAGATIAVGTWPPAMPLLQRALRKSAPAGTASGAPFVIDRVYPLDAMFSIPDEVPVCVCVCTHTLTHASTHKYAYTYIHI